jgi:outer membrane PBP1 activator LpoA protein
MATAKANHLPDLARYVIRPALVEAKLMTEKHARDAVYVATLTEELRDIEVKIAATEEAMQLGSLVASSQRRPCRAPEDRPDANWIREKSRELDLRLRRIEESSKQR